MISIVSATILSGFEGTSYNMFQDAARVSWHRRRYHDVRVAQVRVSGRLAKALSFTLPFVAAQPILARAPTSPLKCITAVRC